MTAPEGSLAQRRAALAHANRIRTYRAQMKAAMKAGQIDPLAVLLSPPPEVETMRVYDLLLAKPKIGAVKAKVVLNRARVSPAKTVGGLSPRQREEIAGLLRQRSVPVSMWSVAR